MAQRFRGFSPDKRRRDQRYQNLGGAFDSLSRALLYLQQGQEKKRLEAVRLERQGVADERNVAADLRAESREERQVDRSIRETEAFDRKGEAARLKEGRESQLFPFELETARERARAGREKLPPESPDEKFLRSRDQALINQYLGGEIPEAERPAFRPRAEAAAGRRGLDIEQPTREIPPSFWMQLLKGGVPGAGLLPPLQPRTEEFGEPFLKRRAPSAPAELPATLPGTLPASSPAGAPRPILGPARRTPAPAAEPALFGTAEEVRSAFRKGDIDRGQAKNLLRRFGIQ